MKKFFLIIIFFLSFLGAGNADRNVQTVTTYRSSALVKTGEAKIYSISFVATSNSGNFIIFDATSDTSSSSAFTNVRAEGSEATADNSKFYDFSNKPLEMSTGIYLRITNGYVVIAYE